MRAQFPSFTVPGGAGGPDKCRRDLGYLIDAIIKDIKGGGNSNTVAFISAYFSNGVPISNGLVGEETQSIYAFNRLRDLCKLAVVNQLASKDVTILVDKVSATNGGANPNTNTNLNPNNCSDVRSAIDTLVAIVTGPLTNGSIASLPYPNPGAWNIGSATNKLIVSRTSGTSKFESGLFELILGDYFISAQTGIVAKITKLNPYRDPATNQIVSRLEINSGSTFFGLLYERLPLPQNPNAIVDDVSKTVIGASKIDNYVQFVNQNFPLSEYAQNVNLVYDNQTGSWVAGDYIRNTKINYVNAVPPVNNRAYDAKKLIQLNKTAIINKVILDITTTYPDFDFPNNTDTICRRDLGYIIDAVCNDLVSGGNANMYVATKAYFEGSGAGSLSGEIIQSVYAFNQARDYMKQAVTNTLSISGAQQDLTIIADASPTSGSPSNTNPTSCANIRSNIDTLIAILTSCLNASPNPSLTPIANLTVTDGAFTVGETVRTRKILYKNKSKGTFFPDFRVTGQTSGAYAEIGRAHV